jgi:hypothetical protein
LIELHWLKILQKHCLAGANWWSAARPGSVVSVEKEAAVQAQHRSRDWRQAPGDGFIMYRHNDCRLERFLDDGHKKAC